MLLYYSHNVGISAGKALSNRMDMNTLARTWPRKRHRVFPISPNAIVMSKRPKVYGSEISL